jgi:bis(5'-nucleosyl)-tetraphosphatase (symmetrical)
MTGRRIFVGDVQGCALEFERLLREVKLDQGRDHLFSVGDLVNKGPDSAESVRIARDLSATAVLGNHEVHLLGKPDRPLPDDLARAKDRDELMAWLRARPVMIVGEDFILVHAGYSPAWAKERPEDVAARLNASAQKDESLRKDQEIRFAITVRYCDPAGKQTEQDDPPPPPPFRPWDEFYRGERMVVFGHWARRGLVIGERVRGLDTGCVYGNKLSAWIAEEDRIVQVAAKRAYSPIGG